MDKNHTQHSFLTNPLTCILPLAAALICITIYLLRLKSVIGFGEPIHVVTSGFEEESLFALWKYQHQQPVYQDPHQIPFAASYFNWVFYVIYGEWVMLTQASDAWLPTVSRLLTILFSLIGFGVTLAWYKKISQHFILALSVSTLIFMGPLVGFWGMTTRPDIPALVCEVLACAWYFQCQERQPWFALFGFIVLCYLAWGFKQINVVMPGALGLMLLWQKQWRSLIVLCLGYFGLVGLTLALAPSQMFEALTFSDTHVAFSFSLWLKNLSNMFVKALPIWVLMFGCFLSCRDKLKQDPMSLFALGGLLIWGMIMLPASSKTGSGDNYHFIAMFFASLIVLRMSPYLANLWQTLAWGSFIVVLIGGVTQNKILMDLSPMHQQHLALKQCMAPFEPPVYIHHHYASLPWMTVGSPYFVIAHNYWSDRLQAYAFESDGIGGLIQSAYFNALILPMDTQDQYDQTALQGYQFTGQCAGMKVYQRSQA